MCTVCYIVIFPIDS
uniref:Uncharacterized protein n=1 Tax=Arundo donax TaxID=35708 RepID=A0A0A8ZB33_ARUDO